MKSLKHLLFTAVVALPSLASANAFNVNEHDAAVTGRAGASAASNTSASSVVFNPGGMAVAEGTNVIVSGSLYAAGGSYEQSGGNKVSTDSNPQFVPSIYATSRLSDLLAIGIGFHLPFGLAISWPKNHPQSDVIQDQSLRTYFITPAVGLNLGRQVPGLSIGVGLDLVPATVQLENTITFGDTQGTAKLGGDAFGVGVRAGVMYNSPSLPALKLGVMWRSNVKLDFSGKGDFDIAEPFRDALPPDGDIKTSITLPQQIWGGVGYAVTPQLELEYNAVWIDWSKFNELRIQLPNSADGMTNVTVEREDYKNTVTHRLGAEFKLPAQQAAIRAGFIYDPTPIPTTTLSAQLPDVDRKMLTLGGSKGFGDYGVHAALLYLLPSERDTSNADPYAPQYKGTYSASAFVLNLSVSGTFGAGAAPSSSSSSSSTPVAAR